MTLLTACSYRHPFASAWTLFTAATVTDDGVRDQLIQYAWDRASFNETDATSVDGPNEFPDAYDASATGETVNHGGGAGYASVSSIRRALPLLTASRPSAPPSAQYFLIWP